MPRPKKVVFAYNKLFYVITRAPIVTAPADCVMFTPSVCTGAGSWATLVQVPKKYNNLAVMELFAHEGAYSSGFVTFVAREG